MYVIITQAAPILVCHHRSAGLHGYKRNDLKTLLGWEYPHRGQRQHIILSTTFALLRPALAASHCALGRRKRANFAAGLRDKEDRRAGSATWPCSSFFARRSAMSGVSRGTVHARSPFFVGIVPRSRW